MRKAVWTGVEQIAVVSNDPESPPLLRAEDVLVGVKAAGVCGTDVHIWEGRVQFSSPPQVLGHEFAGVVLECGSGVTHLRPGDRVKCDSVVGCGVCEWCRQGATQFCPNGWEAGITTDGGWRDLLALPARNLHRLPDEISDAVAAIMDVEVPGAFRKPGVRPGETVAIMGAGPGGLIALQVARLLGAGRVILCGRRRERLDLGKRLGADEIIDTAMCDPVGAVRDLTQGTGADLAMDAAGTEASIRQTIEMLRPQGRAVLYGVMGRASTDFPVDAVVLKDAVVYGALSNRTGWEDLIAWVAQGRLNLESLITHRFPLEMAGEALACMRDRKDGAIKAVLEIAAGAPRPAELELSVTQLPRDSAAY